MRLARLSLLAFGPFSEVTLDLASESPGFHLVYGQNEAGKSTALRAITGLFFGIPHQTPDAHRMAPNALRVGAVLVDDRGQRLEVIRRKGRTKTLLRSTGEVVDECELRTMLGGVGQELFSTLFGLDHVSLRQGAEALLRGKGRVGESLYEAGMGIAGVADVLRSLSTEADSLFTPLARSKPLSEALKSYSETKKRRDVDSVSASAFADQERAIEEARSDVEARERETRGIRSDLHRKRRAQRLIPLAAEQATLSLQRASLGDVVALPDSARADRLEATRALAEAEAKRSRLEGEIARVNERGNALSPRVGAEAGDVLIEELSATVAIQRQRSEEVGRLKAERSVLEQDALSILSRLGHTPTLKGVDSLRVDTAKHERIATLGANLASVRAQLAERRRHLAALVLDRGRARGELAAVPDPVGRAALERSLQGSLHADELERRRREADEEAKRLSDQAVRLFRALDPASPASLEALVQLPFPSLVAVQAFEEEWNALEQEERELASEARRWADRRRSVERDLEAFLAGRDVVSEDDLSRARTERDRILAEWLGEAGPPAEATSQDLRAEVLRAVRSADELADRLRREADRVARHASLEADRRSIADGLAAVDVVRRELDARRQNHRARFEQSWKVDGIEIGDPPQMRAFLERLGELRSTYDESARAELRATALREELAALTTALEGALRAAGRGEALPAESLSALRELAHEASEAAGRRELMRGERQAEVREMARHIDRIEVQIAQAAGELDELEAAWSQAVAPLRLPDAAGTEEALAVLTEIGTLFQKIDTAAQHRAKLETLTAESERFAQTIRGWALQFAPELAERPPVDAAAALFSRLAQARSDRVELQKLSTARLTLEDELGEVQARAAAATERLARLCTLAGVPDPASLELVEERALEARRIERQLSELEARIASISEGAKPTELLEDARGLDPDELAAEIEELDQRLDEAERERDRAHQLIGSRQAGLATLATVRGAADAAADAEAHLAVTAKLARQYVVTRMAATILSREIERYREENQGPLLRRAGELFTRLTRGRYSGLRADLGDDDEPELRCLKADGSEVPMAGLSDGARDQLYLALRLSTLERRLDESEGMPLFLDDILIHFDDERARAALEVLGELSQRTQVIFFTHHRRLAELARAALPEGTYFEHVLPSAPTATASASPS